MRGGLYTYGAIIRSIYDGDTMRVDRDKGCNDWELKQAIRLYGINTGEIRRYDSEIEKALGDAATKAIEALAPIGSEVVLESFKDKDGVYGRLLCRVYIEQGAGWICLNDHLLKLKMAQVYQKRKEDRTPWPTWFEMHKSDLEPLLEKYA